MGTKRKSLKPATGAPSLIRLNKYLADCGVAARRKADALIGEGSVQVNGKTVTELGVKVDPSRDRVTVDGKPVRPVTQRIYLAFYKPENVLTSMEDPLGRTTIADFVRELPMRVFPVGRLDWDTEGLLLLTNDGDFAQKVAHPRTAIPKTYLAKVNGQPTPEKLEKLKAGVTIPGGRASALHVERVSIGDSDKYGWVKIVITEGRNRQVRKMFEKIGFDVKKLKRIAIGRLELGGLRKGTYVFLGPRGIEEALAATWPGRPSIRPSIARAPNAPRARRSRPRSSRRANPRTGHISKRQMR